MSCFLLSLTFKPVVKLPRSDVQSQFSMYTWQKSNNIHRAIYKILLLNGDNMLGQHKGREKKYCLRKAFLENSHFLL